jgi:biotin carboxylase
MKFLVLGSGNAQVDLIRRCKDFGVKVYCCSYKNEGRGIEYADQFDVIDIKDINKIKKYVVDERIDIIYSIGSDLAMPTVAIVSEELKKRCFISSKSALICQNKGKLRKALGKTFEGNVDYITCKNVDEIHNLRHFPYIMKPVDSQGQRGVFKIENFEDLNEKFSLSKSYSTVGSVIIEEFIDGPEISVNCYLSQSKMIFSLISDRITYPNYPGGLVDKHRIPSLFEEKEEIIMKVVNAALKSIGITDGPVYFQIKMQSNSPKIIEITPRFDGCHLWRLIEKAYSINLLDIMIEHLMFKKEPQVISKNLLHTTFYLDFISLPPNTPFQPQLLKIKDPLHLEWYYTPGEEVRSINTYLEKTGYVIYEEEK